MEHVPSTGDSMVLTPRFTGNEVCTDNRGQTMIFTAVLIGIVVLGLVTVVNGSILATHDTASGVERSPPQTMHIVHATEDNVEQGIVKRNRNPSRDMGNMFSQIETSLVNNAKYNRKIIDMSIEDTITGTRIHGSYTPNTTDEQGEVITNLDSNAVGRIAIDVDESTISTQTGVDAYRIEYGDNTIRVFRVDSDTLSVQVTTNGDTETVDITDDTETILIDLGVGKANGYDFTVYDSTASGVVNIENSEHLANNITWSGEVVTPGTGTVNATNFNSNSAVYGVTYNVQVQSQRSYIQTRRLATHGPSPVED